MELYSSVLGKDRGALGLLFELNQLMGILISFWITWWVVTDRYKIQNAEYQPLEWFIWVQSMMVWCSIAVCSLSLLYFAQMNRIAK